MFDKDRFLKSVDDALDGAALYLEDVVKKVLPDTKCYADGNCVVIDSEAADKEFGSVYNPPSPVILPTVFEHKEDLKDLIARRIYD